MANDSTNDRGDHAESDPAHRLLTEIEVAERLHWSRKTLQRRRWLDQEPAYIKVGRSVRYSVQTIDAFIQAGLRRPVHEDRAA